MARTIDISNKLTNEKPKIKIAEGKEYEVNNSKNTVLIMNQKLEASGDEMVVMDSAVKILLGEKAFKEIEAMNLSMPAYKTLFIAIMAAVGEEDFEKTEERFQKNAEQFSGTVV